MLVNVVILVGALLVLLFSAGWFISGASVLAEKMGIPPLLIGMIIIGFGTSSPELLVSVQAAMDNNAALAIGNAVGSNITNITLILGLTAVLAPIAVQSNIVRRELPFLLVATTVLFALGWDGLLSRVDAVILLSLFAVILGWAMVLARQTPDDALADDVTKELNEVTMSSKKAAVLVAVGLVLLTLSSRWLVSSAVQLATALGVSELMIGLTIVALGTSSPELAASVIAARKGEHDLALGNVLGSNLFNTLGAIGAAGLTRPLPVTETLVFRDMPVLLLVTLLLFPAAVGWRGPGSINRWEGALLLTGFAGYTGYLIFSNLS
ncbi:Calcium/sodium antiporter [Acanthopleuribacter pedis]